MSAGSLFLNRGSIPVGYTAPSFPSLSWDLTGSPYQVTYLYNTWDIYRFTVYWFLIFSFAYHMVAALTAIRGSHTLSILWVLPVYGALGAFFGFAAGSICGVILSAIYTADNLHMSTWIPFCWGLLTMIYMSMTRFSTTAYML